MLGGLIGIIITLILVVGIHEAGHALAAWFFSVKIQKIFIGFGKPLLKWKTKAGYELGVGILPLGGYVQLLNTRIQPVPAEKWSICFDKKPVWVRCVILLAGALANFATTLLAFTLVFMLGYRHAPPIVGAIIPTSIGAQASLKSGDEILTLNGQEVNSWQEAGMSIIMSLGKSNVPLVIRDPQGQLRTTTIDLAQWHYKEKNNSLLQHLGIVPLRSLGLIKRESLSQALYHALEKFLRLVGFFFVMLKLLFTGVLPFSVLLGPIGLFTASAHSFLQGVVVFLNFIATFGVAVGVVNLLPIPGLDGGSIAYALLEKIRGKPISVELEVLLHRLFLILFLIILVQLVLNDVKRYFL
jgi:regulator of sigma E protease